MITAQDISQGIQARLTCNIPDIFAYTEQQWADIMVSRIDGAERFVVHCDSCISYAGKATAYDIREIIEQDMQAYGLTQADYEISIGEASAVISAVYCELAAEDEAFIATSFLSSSPAQLISRDSQIIVSSVMTDEPVKLAVSDGTRTYRNIDCPEGFTESNTVTIDLHGLEDHLYLQGIEIDIKAVRVDCAARSKTFYITDEVPDIVIVFRNAFLSLESIEAKAKVTQATEVSRQTAATTRFISQYDLTTEKKYTVEISGLSRCEAEALQQAMASRQMAISCDLGAGQAIVTESTLEFDNDDSALTHAKFTFQFSDRRPKMPAWRLAQMLKAATSIYTYQFTKEFS